jgi:putative hydrolase of the HAD superfamily
MSKKPVRNIIFDLGNVVLNISYQATIDAFKKLGITNFQEIFSKESQNPISDQYERGEISSDQFIHYLKPLCKENVSDMQIIHAWNEIILDFPIRRLQILQQLSLHYRTFCLSNTNALHEFYYNQLLNTATGHPSLDYFFEKVYLSHRIGYRKPEPQAWKIILEENQLDPTETLFLDDSPQHIIAATQLGLQTIHITEEKSMEEVFRSKE